MWFCMLGCARKMGFLFTSGCIRPRLCDCHVAWPGTGTGRFTRITKRAVDGTQPNSADPFLCDTGLNGFGLKVTPADSLVSYDTGKGATLRSGAFIVGRHWRGLPSSAPSPRA
jgi:hypothetical protein